MENEQGFEEVVLKTDRLVLKRLDPDKHAADINATVCETINTLSPWLPWANNIPTIEDTKIGLQCAVGGSKHYGFRIYLNTNSEKVIGICSLVRLSKSMADVDDGKEYEMGYWLHKDYTKQGIMSEAVHQLLEYSFLDLKASRVKLSCDKRNIASQRVAEKTGFSLVREESVENQPELKSTGQVQLHYEKTSL